ncbi:COP23 domain-containing protein [Synechocystis sp. PCC 7509]|uniref:COP23 domain-containing protein n=1 Tax=Synechocystis sp. PCC 7509 TaxID=927677 RepID=UPI0002AC7373|nr:COP23 domain-containing protein [Synechocystis sp. PCC 7509]
MKFSLVLVAVSCSGVFLNLPSLAGTRPLENKPGFWCDTSGTYPITKYQNKKNVQQLWIGWTSTLLSASGYNPVSRCEQVSRRFEEYRSTGKLAIITTSTINNQPVICTGNAPGHCTGLLYTLKPGESAVEAINSIRNLAQNKAGAQIRYESEDDTFEQDIPYVDVRGLIDIGDPPMVIMPLKRDRTLPPPVQKNDDGY